MGQDRVVSIKSVINEVMLEMGNNSKQDYLKYEMWALRCLQELNMFHLPCFETFIATPYANGVIPLPDDFLDYLSIGTVINGKTWTFTRDSKLVVQDADVCECESETLATTATTSQSGRRSSTEVITLRMQQFTGVAGTRTVTVTEFDLNDAYLVFVNDTPQKSCTKRTLNTLTFLGEFNDGDIIEIYN